jgi:transcriptional regulator with XRE-family HTH domain
MQLLINIGDRLRERRKELHLTQSQVAVLLEMSLTFYGGIERGNNRISLEKIILVQQKLGVDPTYLLTGNKPFELNINDILVVPHLASN